MADHEEPIVLELAPLPREQVGPFLILGVDKDAGPEQVEANWARRVVWARKGQLGVPLQDVNWAREILADPDKRVAADAASLNADTTEHTLRGLEQEFGIADAGSPAWAPLDVEQPPLDYTPPVDVPDPEAVRRATAEPDLPADEPAAAVLLEQFARAPLDPWKLGL